MGTNQTILVAPLDWGLGHATRCIPLIKQFVLENHVVIIAGQGSSLELLKQEFPELQTIKLKGYRVTYSQKGFSFLKMLWQVPFFGFSMVAEHVRLRKWVTKLKVSTVISDNRYGLWHPKTLNVILTHQLFIQLPSQWKWFEPCVHWATNKLLNRFHECWVPDFEEFNSSLSGKLSHGEKKPQHVKFIGPLSRFYKYELPIHFEVPVIVPDVLVLISGPEPFRTVFQKEMENRFSKSPNKVLLVCGKPAENISSVEIGSSNMQVASHLSTPEIFYYLKFTPRIIALGGYSTLMDLYVMGRTAELIATPGQTEQEYLVGFWSEIQSRNRVN